MMSDGGHDLRLASRLSPPLSPYIQQKKAGKKMLVIGEAIMLWSLPKDLPF